MIVKIFLLYLIANTADGHIEEKDGSKYLMFASTDENKEVLKCTKFWDEFKYLTKTINGGKLCNYEKDFMKIKFSSDDDFPFNKQLKFHVMTIIIRTVFEENGKYCLQYFQMNVFMSQKNIAIRKN